MKSKLNLLSPDEHMADLYGGGLMLIVGIAAAERGFSYGLGTVDQMGPGFFPFALGIVLIILSLISILTAGRSEGEAERKETTIDFRAWAYIVLGTAAFVVLGEYGGLLPATFAIVFFSALANRENTIRSALLLAAAMMAIATAVFWWALQLHLPLIQWG